MINFAKNSKLKKLLIVPVLAFVLLSSSITGLINSLYTSVKAATKQAVALVSNSNFDNHTTAKPGSPSNWTLINPNNDESLKAGVILTGTEFGTNKKDYKLESNPERPNDKNSDADYKNLMLNAHQGAQTAGYQSTSFTLEKDSYYELKIDVKTTGIAFASIYLDGLSNTDADAKIEYFSTNDSWRIYTLYIATNEFNAETVSLQLYLGSKTETSTGAVFFNEVSTVKYSQDTFYTHLNNLNSGQTQNVYKTVLLNNQKQIAVTNGDFEKVTLPGDNRQVAGFESLEKENNAVITNEDVVAKIVSTTSSPATGIIPAGSNHQLSDTTNNVKNQNVLFMQNRVETYQGLQSSDITLPKHAFVQISFWAKSNSAEATTPTAKLIEKNVNNLEEFTALSKDISIATTQTTNAFTNNWIKYSFLVETHPTESKTFNLQFLLGTSESKAKGYVFIDQIEMQNISYDIYSGSEITNSAKLSFNDDNNQFTVPNDNFNLTQPKTNEFSYPATPRNWTHSFEKPAGVNDSHIVSGIVNTNAANFANVEIKTTQAGLKAVNPGNLNENEPMDNNVLMLGQTAITNQKYQSEQVTLAAQSYFKVSFMLNTQFAYKENAGAEVRIVGNAYTVFEASNLYTANAWKEYTVYIKTANEIIANIELNFNGATGYVFFDNVRIESATESVFLSKDENRQSNEFLLDYAVEDFNHFNSNSDKALNTPYIWNLSQEQSDSVEFGILNTNKLNNTKYENDLPALNPEFGDSVLMINNKQDAITTATHKLPITVAGGSYSKVIVRVKTFGITQEEQSKQVDSDNYPIIGGAKIKLNSYTESFTSINTEKQINVGNETQIQNNWAYYEFYLNPESSMDVLIEASLGFENAKTSGYLFIDGVQIVALDKETFIQETENASISPTKLLLTQIEDTNETPEEPNSDNFTAPKFDFLLVSSIITVLAILVALIGAGLRKVNFKKYKKVKIKTSYDRRHTTEKQLAKEERIRLRKQIIDELQAEFDEIDVEIATFIKENDDRIASIKEKANIKKLQYKTQKDAIIQEIKTLTSEYHKVKNSETDKVKLQTETTKFEKQVLKLENKQRKVDAKANKKVAYIKAYEERLKQYIERQEYRKQLIKLEIERIEKEVQKIESEIAEVSLQEERMWQEYREAKRVAKQQKQDYYERQKLEKQKVKEQKRVAKQLKDASQIDTTENDVNNDNKNIEEINNVEETNTSSDNDNTNSSNE